MLGTLALAACVHTPLLQVGQRRVPSDTGVDTRWAPFFQVHDRRYWCMQQVEQRASQWWVPVPGRLQPRRER